MLIYLSYLIFSKYTLTLENLKFDVNFPIVQVKKKNNINLIKNKSRIYFDIKFTNGLDFVFLSDNEYTSYLALDFFIRFIFKKNIKTISFLFYRQLIFLSIIGQKYYLLSK